MKNNATPTLARAAACLGIGLALLLAGCGALPDKPARATLYDFGPGIAASAATGQPPAAALPTLALAEIESNTRLDGTQILYRLGYADANELRPYGQSRWSLPPAQLLRQRQAPARLAVGTQFVGIGIAEPVKNPVSYTHLTLPTNREV